MQMKAFASMILVLSAISGTTLSQTWTQVAHGAKLDTTWAGEVADVIRTTPGTYLAATSTGLWRSTDDGATWSAADLGITSSGPATFYAHPDGRIFCGTWVGGLFVSSDSGLTWTHSAGHPALPIQRVVSDSKGRLFTALWPGPRIGGVCRSTDNGVTWKQVLDSTYVEVVAIGPGDVVFAGSSNGIIGQFSGGLMRSTDAGDTWQTIYPWMGVRSVIVAKDGSILMGGYIFTPSTQLHTFRSTDNGQTWKQCAGFYSEYYATDSNHVIYAACDSGMRKSADNGVTWTAMNTGLLNRNGQVPWLRSLRRVGDSVLIAGEYHTGEIFRSKDLGAHWSAAWRLQSSQFVPGKLIGIAAKKNGQLFLGSSAYGMLRWDAAGGLVRINSALGSQSVQSVLVAHTGDVFAGTTAGIYRSANNGASWAKFGSTTASMKALMDLPDGAILGGSSLGVIKFAPDGSTFAAMNKGLVNRSVNTFCMGTDSTIFAGTEDGLYRLDSVTWVPVAVSSGGALKVFDIHAAAQTMAVATRDSGIYVSTDNGQHWMAKLSGLEGMRVGAIMAAAPDRLFAATEQHGVYAATAGGGAWAPITQGLVDLNMRGLALGADGYLYAVTDSGGVFKTTSRVTHVEAGVPAAPREFVLGQNYPNPFNPRTTITYELPRSAEVTLSVYDALGRMVAALVGDVQPQGRYAVQWDASDAPSGVYFYRLQAGEYRATKRMLVVK